MEKRATIASIREKRKKRKKPVDVLLQPNQAETFETEPESAKELPKMGPT